MIKYLQYLTIFGFFLTASSEAAIYTASSFKNVYKIIKMHQKDASPEKTWVAIDLDMTLLKPSHQALYESVLQHYRQSFLTLMQNLSDLEVERAFTHAILLSGQQLLDEKAPKYLERLKCEGFRVFGFTASLVGQLPGINSVAIRRTELLETLGVNFDKAPNFAAALSFKSFPLYNGAQPLWFKNVLFTNGGRAPYGKEDVFISMLKQQHTLEGEVPVKVIVVDDRLKTLEAFEKALTQLSAPKIQFIGIHFSGRLAEAQLSGKAFMTFWQAVIRQVKNPVSLKAS